MLTFYLPLWQFGDCKDTRERPRKKRNRTWRQITKDLVVRRRLADAVLWTRGRFHAPESGVLVCAKKRRTARRDMRKIALKRKTQTFIIKEKKKKYRKERWRPQRQQRVG